MRVDQKFEECTIRPEETIGTSKQGHGQGNKLSIPQPVITEKYFYKRLGNYKKKKRIINGYKFLFVAKETRQTSKHACTINNIEENE